MENQLETPETVAPEVKPSFNFKQALVMSAIIALGVAAGVTLASKIGG